MIRSFTVTVPPMATAGEEREANCSLWGLRGWVLLVGAGFTAWVGRWVHVGPEWMGMRRLGIARTGVER